MKENVEFKINYPLSVDQAIDIFRESGINRHIEDKDRIAKMFSHYDILITAWIGSQPIGLSRSLTDFSFCCYLSDLAVIKKYQSMGIGKKLIEITHEVASDHASLILLAAPSAVDYYPKVGMEKHDACFMIKRK
ncbi:GNAT family N-acetyltransferase [soil metagenome]